MRRRIAEKGGKPEDQGLNFPEYACHGGGKLLSPSLSLFEIHCHPLGRGAGLNALRVPNLDERSRGGSCWCYHRFRTRTVGRSPGKPPSMSSFLSFLVTGW